MKTTESYRYNPYIMGPPVTGTAFYGRQEVFRFVRETLATPQQNVVVLYGQRRIGKTSILLQLPDHLPPDAFYSIYFDLQGKEALNLSEVLYGLAVEIAKELPFPSPRWADFSDTDYFQSRFLPAVREKLGDKRLVLLFDEFDVLGQEEASPSDVAAITFFPYLQEMVTNVPFLAFAFVVGRRIDELPTRFRAIFKRARSMRISVLSRENANKLITSPAKGQLEYPPEALDAILGLTSGHPYFTQVVCHELFNYLHPPDRRLVTSQDVTDVLAGVMEKGAGGFTWFWEGLPHTEQFILSAIAEITEESGFATEAQISQILQQYRIWLLGIELSSAPQRLVEWEMLEEREAGSYQFAIELVRRWVLQTHPLEEVKQEIESASAMAARDYENAREAHVAGDLEMAISDYHLALSADPKHAGARLGLARALHEQGELGQAVEEYERAFELDAVNAQDELIAARIAFAQWLEEQDLLDKAAEQYRCVLQLLPNERQIQEKLTRLYEQGLSYANSGQWQEAVTLFEHLQTICPGYEDVPAQLRNAKDHLTTQKHRMMRLAIGSVVALLLGLGLVLAIPSVRNLLFAPTLTPTEVALLPSLTPTLSPTNTSQPTPTNTLTATPTPTTISPTDTPLPTGAPTSTDTPMPTATPIIIVVTATPVPTPTPTPTPTLLPNPLGDMEIWDVDINPNNGQEIYVVASGRGIYKTTSGGIAWDLVEDEYKNIECLTMDPQDPKKLYAGLWEAILKSTDGSTTWKAVTVQSGSGLPLHKTVHVLVVVPDNSHILYAGTGGGVYKSSDQGETWKAKVGGMGETPIYNIILTSTDGKQAYAAGQAAEIFKTVDGGNSPWTKIPCSYGEEELYSLSAHSENDQIFYTGSDKSRVSITTNGGYTWNLSQEGFRYRDLRISILVVDRHNPDTIYAGTGDKSNLANDGIYKSTNSGRTWTPINAGLPRDSRGRHVSILAIATDPNDSQTVYAGGLGGLYKSTDGGESWERQ
jgi:photosystem II stability/assembly factor-like uncharacterized protein/tetratricopeptide (TPR) repeat protein